MSGKFENIAEAAGKKAAFLFPGQGSQAPGMAREFYEASASVRTLFELASDILALDAKKLLFESGADALKRTDIAQPALTLANLSAAEFLRERGVLPFAAAGHSLGEYAALCVLGVIPPETCFSLVKARGEAMHRCVEDLQKSGGGGGMAAVLGISGEEVESLILKWKEEGRARGSAAFNGLYAANFNSAKQTVVSGTKDALAAAEGRFKEAGARRFVRLQVAGPFHSPFMEGAAREFEQALDGAEFASPSGRFFSNVSGAEVSGGAEEIKTLAVKQITSPVRWTAEEAAIEALGVDFVFEAGPGAVLTGLWRDTGSKIKCL